MSTQPEQDVHMDPDAKSAFRVTTNGIRYRIEKLVDVGFWLWKRKEWMPLGRYLIFSEIFQVEEFHNFKDAKDKMEKLIQEEQADIRVRMRGWKPVTT